MGVLADQLATITDPRDRARVKAQAMAVLSDMVGKSVARGAFTITLASLSLHPRQDLLVFTLKVTRTSNGKDVTPADLNPIRVYNPPILVDDPAGDIVQTSTDPVTQEVTTRRLREDLRACLLDIVRGIAQARLG